MDKICQSGRPRIFLSQGQGMLQVFYVNILRTLPQNILTALWLYGHAQTQFLMDCAEELVAIRDASPNPESQIVIDSGTVGAALTDRRCLYYLANHTKRTIYWLHDVALFPSMLGPIYGKMQPQHFSAYSLGPT
jgi:hypothetical protein